MRGKKAKFLRAEAKSMGLSRRGYRRFKRLFAHHRKDLSWGYEELNAIREASRSSS